MIVPAAGGSCASPADPIEPPIDSTLTAPARCRRRSPWVSRRPTPPRRARDAGGSAACRLTCAFASCLERELSLRRFSTSWRGAGWRFFEPGGLPGPGLPGFGAPAGQGTIARMFLNPRRTRAGVSRPGGAGRSQGRRRSAASGRARRSWAWQAMISQVHRSAARGSRIFGTVHPRTCLNSRKVCSRSNRRKNACHSRSTSAGAVPVPENHSHAGLGSRSPGR